MTVLSTTRLKQIDPWEKSYTHNQHSDSSALTAHTHEHRYNTAVKWGDRDRKRDREREKGGVNKSSW
jgi:hypothetical protein